MSQTSSMSLPWEEATKKKTNTTESNFYKQIREGTKRIERNLILTRLETWLTAGIPDLLVCDEKGRFHLIELKVSRGNTVDLRPHQVAFLNTHSHASTWVLIKKQPKNSEPEILLYKGKDALDLKVDGMAKVEPTFRSGFPVDWGKFWGLISLR